MSRKSDRSNKGVKPSYLKEYVTDDHQESDSSEEDLETTIMAGNDGEDETNGIKELIESLSKRFLEVQTTLTQQNNELRAQLEETRNEFLAVQPKNVPVQTSSSSTSTVTSSASSTSTVTSSATNTTPSSSTNTFTTSATSTNTSPTIASSSFPQPPNSNWTGDGQPHFFRRNLLALPPFDGSKPIEWPSFLREYNRTTLQYNYSSAENMSRLTECLKGKARFVVQGLLGQDNMTEKVLERVKSRFGRTEFIVEAQLQELSNYPNIPENRLKEIIPFADDVVNFAEYMIESDCQHHLSNPQLLNTLILKLPTSYQVMWLRDSSKMEGHINIKHFSDWIEQLADDINRIPAIIVPTPRVPEKKTFTRKANVFHTSETPKEQPKKTSRCNVCQGEHTVSNCLRFLGMSHEQKLSAIREKRLCFYCLRSGHERRNCRSRKRCGKNGCTDFHHQSLHTEKEQPPPPLSIPANYHATSQDSSPRVLFKMLPVKLHGDKGIINTYAFIDEGSSISLINRELANKLGLKGPKRTLSLQWFGDQKTTEESQSVKLKISGVHSSAEVFELHDVCAVSNLNLPSQTLDMNQLHSKYQGLRNLPIASYKDVKPEILIGLNYCHLGIPQRAGGHNFEGLIVSESSLGWIVYGRSNCSSEPIPRMLHLHEPLEELNTIVKEYFTTENFGVKMPSKKIEADDDKRARDILQNTTKRIGERFESGLLWKRDDIQLPNSFAMAEKRLITVENKMKKDKTYAAKYHQTINSYIEKGYARKLNDDELDEKSPRVWYLPHFGVLNPNKPDKFRLVFDAAATSQGSSLNSALTSGPDMNQPLISVLCKFRERKVGICADIKEMFHQIVIRGTDQDSQRFLWREDPSKPIETFKMLVMTFGSTSSPCTAQYVKNINALEHQQKHPEAVSAILEKHYVDDYVDCFDDENIAIEIASTVKRIHRAGGFELRGFVSNSKRVAQCLNAETCSQVLDVNMDVDAECDKILGMTWNTTSDEFRFQLKFHKVHPDVMSCRKRPTKREFLAIVMSVYDPFGFLADFLIYMKLLLQSVWRSGINWDEPLPPNLHELWSSWRSELEQVKLFRVPRCHFPAISSATDIELHVFVDASEVAFAAVCYMRVVVPGLDSTVSFIMGKTKCAPNKYLSVPRLELQAALLGVRLYNVVIQSHNLKFTKTTFWSDSRTVLHWINDDRRRYKSFVANRISEILDSTAPSQWKWIPSQHNVADDATRDSYPPKFEVDSRWIQGPLWLQKEQHLWPSPVTQEEEEVSSNEIETELQPLKHQMLVLNSEKPLFDYTRFSSFFRLLRTVAWSLRFVHNMKATLEKRKLRRSELIVKEISMAESFLCRTIQLERYPEEHAAISSNKPVNPKSVIHQLTPCLDVNGVLRLSGRIENAPTIPLSTKRPVILPHNHYVTRLIVNHYHNLCRHNFEDLTICEIRMKYWVSHLRVLVRTIKKDCQHCKNENAKPKTPQMGQLPIDRLTPFIRPFSYTGLDYFGPVHVTIGRRKEKRWVALFTCLTIRAIHMEIAEDLSTDSCILCLRNFMNIRGLPVRLRSDNGTNFVGAKGEILTASNLYDKDVIKSELSMKGIEWIFNCPSNPSAGGCWERLIRSVKTVLNASLKEVSPRVETLRSYLLEAVNIVNSRPLTHVPVSSLDDEPLTPNCFLLGTPNAIQSAGPVDEKLWCFRKQWRISNSLKNHFWRRWVKEYLPTLTRRTKYFERVEPLKKGDLVIICDEDVSRSQWLRGIVEKVITAKDGQVRQAEVRTSNGRILKRPASKLAVLDVGESSPMEIIHGGQDVGESLEERERTSR